MFCGESEQPQTFISETSYVKVIFYIEEYTDQVSWRLVGCFLHSSVLSLSPQTYFTFDTRAEQQMEVYLRYGQHPELYPNRRGEIVPGYVG